MVQQRMQSIEFVLLLLPNYINGWTSLQTRRYKTSERNKIQLLILKGHTDKLNTTVISSFPTFNNSSQLNRSQYKHNELPVEMSA